MANNFVNAIKTNITASAIAPTTVYSPSSIKAICIELDVANKSSAGQTVTIEIEDISEIGGSVSSAFASGSDLAAGTFTTSNHQLVVGDRLLFTNTTDPTFTGTVPSGDTTLSESKVYFVQAVPNANTFRIAETRGATSALLFSNAGVAVTYKKKARATIVSQAPVPVGGALKVISGQKLVLDNGDLLLAYASSASELDVVASVLADVS